MTKRISNLLILPLNKIHKGRVTVKPQSSTSGRFSDLQPGFYPMSQQHRTPRRRGINLILLATILIVSLSGCSNPTGRGQSLISAQNSVLAIPGVETAKFTLKGAYSGFQQEWGEDITITLKPGFQPKNTAAFVEYLFTTAWSVTEHNPESIGIILNTTPQVNLDSEGKLAGWTNLKTFADQPSIVVAGTVILRKQLGAWPCTPPKKNDQTALIKTSE